MVKRYAFLWLLSIALILSACQSKVARTEPPPHWFDYYTSFHKKDYQKHFAAFVDSLSDTSDIHQTLIRQYYQENGYEQFWTCRGIQEGRMDTLFRYLSSSYEHGISDDFFDFHTLSCVVERLKSHRIENNANIYDTLSKLEISLTRAYLKYVETLNFGATDPKVVNGGKWLMTTLHSDSAFISETLKQMKELSETLHECQPRNSEYLALQKELHRLYNLSDSTFVPIREEVVFKGQSSPVLAAVCSRLKLTGELSRQFLDAKILTDKLLEGINRFRKNNAIPESDSLDVETIRKLNRPISYYVNTIAVNLERLRWQVVPQKQRTYLAVNIPDFTLQTFVEDTLVFKTRICCGKTQNPKLDPARTRNGLVKAFKAESPLLYGEIKRIVLNPEWSIPYDIIKDEYYYKLCKSNTAVVNREKLFVKDVRTGQQVNPEDINWTAVDQRNIPYRLYQSSGPRNALGLVKFDFANAESVYLHDTNNKGAFKRRTRALSHGCIRVENPFVLANLLYELNDFDTTKIEQLGILVGNEPTTEEGVEFLEQMMKKDSIRESQLTDAQRPFYRKLKPTGVSLKNKMPLYIEYRTCFVGDGGQIQYREDVYYKDGNISKFVGNL